MKVWVTFLAQRQEKGRSFTFCNWPWLLVGKGVITHIPQKGVVIINTTTGPTLQLSHKGYPHIHTPYSQRHRYTASLSQRPPSNLTSKAGLPKHFNSDSTHNIFQNKHTLPSPLTHNTLPSLSQHTSAVFNLVSLHLPFHCLRLNSCLLRHCHLWEQ
jgi:hypothetical protein